MIRKKQPESLEVVFLWSIYKKSLYLNKLFVKVTSL